MKGASVPRKIPGLDKGPGREFIYIEVFSGEAPGSLAEELFEFLATLPASGRTGGVLEEAACLSTRTGHSFAAFSYNGDLEKWRAVLQEFAQLRGREVATVADGHLVASSLGEIPLADCQVRFL
jgi:hypothetical protein